MRYKELKAQPKGAFSSFLLFGSSCTGLEILPIFFFLSPHFDIHSVYSNNLT